MDSNTDVAESHIVEEVTNSVSLEKEVPYSKLMAILSALEERDSNDPSKFSVDTTIPDKLTFFVGELIGILKPLAIDYTKKVARINTKLCSVNKSGNIIRDERGNMTFTPDKSEKRDCEVYKLQEELVKIDLTGCICDDKTRITKLPIHIVKELNGFLFNITADDYK